MSSARKIRLFHTLSFRLVAGSLAGFLIALILSWFLVNRFLENVLVQRLDRSIETEVLDVAAVLERLGPQPPAVAVNTELERFGHSRGIDRVFFRVFDGDGRLLGQSDLNTWPKLDGPDSLQHGEDFFTWQTLEWDNRKARTVWFDNPDGYLLQIGMDLSETQRFLAWGQRLFAGTLLFVAVFGSILGWLAIARPIGGINGVSGVAGRIADEMDFQQRVSVGTGSEETDRLAVAFNTMLEKIQLLIGSQKEIMDNIAHDIRSPVARMRAAAESQLGDSDLAGRIVEDCDQILHLINLLLEISSTEAGLARWHMESLDLVEVARDAAELFAPLLEMKEMELTMDLPPNCPIRADRKAMQRVVANLLDNAVKYTPDGGHISIRLELTERQCSSSICDTGAGIPEEDLPRIFDRFFRVDSSRSQPGSGLGLSYCRATVSAMGGTLECSSRVGEGSTFTFTMPLHQ